MIGLKNLAKESIRIEYNLEDDDISIGTSKIGGTPDLPPSITWPFKDKRPLSLIAQLNLSEVAAYDQMNLLPHSGWLYFFYDAE